MNIVRYVGYALLACAVLLLGYEIFRYLEAHSIHLLTVQQAWRDYNAAGLDHFNKSVSQSYLSGFIGGIISFLMGLPLLVVVVSTGAFLLFISRHSEAAQ